MPATKKSLCNPGLSGLSVACSAGVAPANATPPFGVPFGQSASYRELRCIENRDRPGLRALGARLLRRGRPASSNPRRTEGLNGQMLNQDSPRARGPAGARIRIPGKSGPAPALQGATSGLNSPKQTVGLSASEHSPQCVCLEFHPSAIGVPHRPNGDGRVFGDTGKLFQPEECVRKSDGGGLPPHGNLSIRGVSCSSVVLMQEVSCIPHLSEPSPDGRLYISVFMSSRPRRQRLQHPGTDRWRLRRVPILPRGSILVVYSAAVPL
jgi:hypothetical protein